MPPKPISVSSRSRTRHWRARAKAKIVELLGGKCVRCGFDNPLALCLDHVKGDGYLSRRPNSGVGHDEIYTMYDTILKDIETKGGRFQLLCANCNKIKQHENHEFGNGGVTNKSMAIKMYKEKLASGEIKLRSF